MNQGVLDVSAVQQGDRTQERIGDDTALRCVLALITVRIGMRLIEFGARRVSRAHPARYAYKTAVGTWRDRVRAMPWWGFVPNHRVISATQASWLLLTLLFADASLCFVGLPFVHLHGLLINHIPRLQMSVHLRPPRHR